MLLSSGPHHGHYVSIIKAGGVWKLFDDDAVETIKESDIPKYFGDSNCGSAYVLYYQAVDINLPSLGLRPPTPQPHPEFPLLFPPPFRCV
jgi:ubiquitin carboxyl-terminal hydrolase 9/13